MGNHDGDFFEGQHWQSVDGERRLWLVEKREQSLWLAHVADTDDVEITEAELERSWERLTWR